MSKIKIIKSNNNKAISLDDVKGNYSGVPIFFVDKNNEDTLAMLTRDCDDDSYSYKEVLLHNGHVQTGFKYKTLDEFFKVRKDWVKFVDLDVTLKYL